MPRLPSSSSSRLPTTSSSRIPPTPPPRLRISPRLLLLRYRHVFRRRPVSILLLSLLSIFIFWFFLSATWHLLAPTRNSETQPGAAAFLAGEEGEGEGLLDARGRRKWRDPEEREGGTDIYVPSRTGEILSTWKEGFGLEVDAWDPRTHDPRKDPDSYGVAVQLKPQEQRYFLSAMIFNRVFKGDRFNITIYELRQWMEFMKYAGVSHVFWYDTAHTNEEAQERALSPYVKQGFMTYHRFHHLYPGNLDAGYHFEQDQSEIHCLNEYGLSTKWLVVADVDEYVFFPKDTSPGFFERFVRVYEEKYPDVSQLLFQTMLFVGKPKLPLPSLVVERYRARQAWSRGVALFGAGGGGGGAGGGGCVALAEPRRVRRRYPRRATRHREMQQGRTVALRAGDARVNHYQGERGRGREETEDLLVEDDSIQPIADELRKILHVKPQAGVRGGKHYYS